jgi:hypothetical protein
VRAIRLHDARGNVLEVIVILLVVTEVILGLVRH